MALTTAIAFLCLFLNFATLLGPAYFPFRSFAGPTARARMLRAFLPASFLGVLIHGLIFKSLSSFMYINSALLLAISAFAFALVTTLFTLEIARMIGGRIDDAEKAMVEFSKLKTEFINNISHEFRSPLNRIIEMGETASQQTLNQNQKQCVENIQDSGKHLLRLVDDILSFSKITSEGTLTHDKASFPLSACFQKITQSLEPLAQKRPVSLRMETGPDVPICLYENEKNLSQVLFHLIENAIKFSSQGEVLVRVQKEYQKKKREFLRFEIIDSGSTLPVEIQKGMFHIFFQTADSHYRKYGGLGIRLALCKTIVTAMGGTIGYECLKKGGAKFWFSIKLESQVAIAAA